MDKHDGLAPVQLGIKRLEIRMADVFVVDAGQQGDAVQLELIQRVGGLR
jgi:hypothetical protein